MYRAPDKDMTKCIIDSYSCGIVAFMMCTGEFPFLKYNDEGYKKFQADPNKVKRDRGLKVSDELVQMVAGLTHGDIEERFDLQEAQDCAWMQKECAGKQELKDEYF